MPTLSAMSDPAIIEITKTCIACPAQWEGQMSSGEAFYVRYRNAFLTIGFGPNIDAAVVAASSAEGYEWENVEADGLDGWMEWEVAEPHFAVAWANHLMTRNRTST